MAPASALVEAILVEAIPVVPASVLAEVIPVVVIPVVVIPVVPASVPAEVIPVVRVIKVRYSALTAMPQLAPALEQAIPVDPAVLADPVPAIPEVATTASP